MKLSERFDSWILWLTSAPRNLRSFSVLRIIYGAGLLLTLVPSIPERSMLWGPASFWVDPEAKRRGYFLWDTILTKQNELLFDIAFFAMILIVFLFMIGFQTRIMVVLTLIFVVALQANNLYVLNGGDTLYRITLLFLIFANLGEHYSVDAWLSKRRKSRHTRRRVVPAYISSALHNTALVLCCFQIIIVYAVSGVWKLSGEEWMDGTALFYALRIDAFMLYPAFNELLWQSSMLIYVATFIALWSQTLFPLAILWRPTRIFVLVTLVFMHSGIGILLGLWPFSLAMIALDMLFIRDKTWVSMTAWGRSTALWRKVEGFVEKSVPHVARTRTASSRRRGVAPEEAARPDEPTPSEKIPTPVS